MKLGEYHLSFSKMPKVFVPQSNRSNIKFYSFKLLWRDWKPICFMISDFHLDHCKYNVRKWENYVFPDWLFVLFCLTGSNNLTASSLNLKEQVINHDLILSTFMIFSFSMIFFRHFWEIHIKKDKNGWSKFARGCNRGCPNEGKDLQPIRAITMVSAHMLLWSQGQ